MQAELTAKVDAIEGHINWVKPETLHLTLKFLGEVKDSEIVSVCDIVKQAVETMESFELDIQSVGYFGGKSARVLWVGTGPGSQSLKKMHNEIADKLDLAGWPKDGKEFAGHLTLCRIKNSQTGVKLAKISELYSDFKLGTLGVDSVSIYQSQLHPKGAEHTRLSDYPLKRNFNT